ncbi:MAG: DUF3108 domain-containing protein [Paracoccaceae bacterium]
MRLNRMAVLLALCSWASGTLADKTSDEFDVYIQGLQAGRLSLVTQTKGSGYAARILLRTTGLAAKLLRYRFEATVQGRSHNGHHRPVHYSEKSDTGKRQTDKTITYVNGLAKVTQSKKRKPHWLKPKSQRNRLDPLTATYELLRDRPKDTLCQQSLKLFDGARAVDIILADPKSDRKGITCRGRYKRVGGFSEAEMSKGVSFPFKLTYVPAPNGDYQVQSLKIETLRGRASFLRR